MKAINPFTGELIREYQTLSKPEIDRKLETSQEAFLNWKTLSYGVRAAYLMRVAEALELKSRQLAELMAAEMGKPLKAGMGEIEKCALVCRYYARHAEEFLKPEAVDTGASLSYIAFQPLGVILAVMPWNFPFWQSFRFLAPGLMAGNTAVLKHASNVPGCALAIEEILRDAGLPQGVFQTLLVKSTEVEEIIKNPIIKAVTLTGSTGAGMKVAGQAASLLKKAVLELGGSDPYIVLEDADIELAAAKCAESRLINTGQSCIAAKRFIVVEQVAESFTASFKRKMAAKQPGDPMDENTEIGPMATVELRDELHAQIQKSIEAGAVCILGGKIEQGSHALYPPTILTKVKKGMPAYDEEMFGPVASVIVVKDEDEAIRVANDTVFGLGSAVFTEDLQRGSRIAERMIDAGCCFINDYVRSIPELPFGGIKQSGYGRELGVYGIKEFVNVKTIYRP
ncbi:succinate-semialdehyde dehydrogenase/glutarate-semialdehyde dehydrogenase [Arcticibacter pallidicorallinus]|uniref:Succinate-semialdehyde dehydrogenase/glutarate-semialdehyde dehydrogenase n=1 Tax=Arcticibacter pallidicorallinus TaxID=1259464 RepID=A0A2T0U563_9SPHI|nr:NAD-dependent succinate-semialdehyde dehydrogenase [Arcticibacter pallidicorallinus]PRY53032.1 succinate-semialdehyde dehydrogenase/glutarate-semialdehyde dehydrogenase [Arcticibacter pallidicorallinus]